MIAARTDVPNISANLIDFRICVAICGTITVAVTRHTVRLDFCIFQIAAIHLKTNGYALHFWYVDFGAIVQAWKARIRIGYFVTSILTNATYLKIRNSTLG